MHGKPELCYKLVAAVIGLDDRVDEAADHGRKVS